MCGGANDDPFNAAKENEKKKISVVYRFLSLSDVANKTFWTNYNFVSDYVTVYVKATREYIALDTDESEDFPMQLN